ncbi:MAG: diadenosine tetraphosphate hydrolase [Chloroflexota bacterium]|nr:diadenosine tetraphosphate hydrolase [Chloroflexota bacterium]
MVEDWRQDRMGVAERGENPTVLARLTSGFAVIGDTQFLPGYCLLLASPRVGHLTDLPLNRRSTFLREMSLIGEAIEAVCRPHRLRRVNYEILGNTDPYLHAHVFPRYDWEPVEYVGHTVFRYPPEKWSDSRYQLSEKTHGLLRAELTQALRRLVGDQGLEGAGG